MVRITSATTAALLLACTLGVTAQQSAIQQTRSFEENGIHVIMAPAENQIVSVIIGMEGGLVSGESTNPAIGSFTTDLLTEGGSQKYSKDVFRKFLSETSTSIYGGGDVRGISYNMRVTLPNFDKAWDVLASIVKQPLYDTVSFNNIKQRRLNDVSNRWTNPQNQASLISDSLVKLGHPILSRWTTANDVESITIPMIQDFQRRLSERSRMLIVVVGNVTEAQVRKKLADFAGLPLGSYKPPMIQPLTSEMVSRVEVVDRPVVTAYIYSSFPGPSAVDPDFWPLRVGLSYLRANLFEEVRTKRNLSYAPGSYLSTSLGQGVGVLSVSTTMPDSTIGVMYAELEKIKRGEIDEKALEDSKAVFTTGYYMGQMTNDDRAGSLYSAQRNAGDWRRAYSFDAINSVDKASVVRAFRTYANKLQVGIVGKKETITQAKFYF